MTEANYWTWDFHRPAIARRAVLMKSFIRCPGDIQYGTKTLTSLLIKGQTGMFFHRSKILHWPCSGLDFQPHSHNTNGLLRLLLSYWSLLKKVHWMYRKRVKHICGRKYCSCLFFISPDSFCHAILHHKFLRVFVKFIVGCLNVQFFLKGKKNIFFLLGLK